MIFSSLQFVFLYLPICFLVYFFLAKNKLFVGSKMWLVAASLFFYGYWKVDYLVIILASLFLNFALGTALSQSSGRGNNVNRKMSLIIGIVLNLMLLGYFKYANFFVENVNAITSLSLSLPNVVLPLAISFFTFQQIAYLVDSYKGETSEYDLLNYMLFVTFFPQLIAGPIVHHHEMMQQFKSRRNLSPRLKNISAAVFIFSIGLFKKVVIADTFSIWADAGFSYETALTFYDAWSTSLSYTFQLYFDFSGYCDMAIGAALLFNIRLPLNFNSPYKSFDIQDFWRRWHITLGRFLRDYIYIPLGGSRRTEFITYSNLFVTFLIGGLWHGASWMFVVWGALHGLALVVHRFWKSLGGKLPKSIAWLVTFLFINVTWVFFRAEKFSDAKNVIYGMLNLNEGGMVPTEKIAWLGVNADRLMSFLPAHAVGAILPLFAICLTFIIVTRQNATEMIDQKMTAFKMIYVSLLFTVSIYVMSASSTSVFLYFNF